MRPAIQLAPRCHLTSNESDPGHFDLGIIARFTRGLSGPQLIETATTPLVFAATSTAPSKLLRLAV